MGFKCLIIKINKEQARNNFLLKLFLAQTSNGVNKKYQDSSSIMYWIIGSITVVVILLIVFLASRNSISSKTNREVALSCTTEMATQFHIHPTLEIIINGQKQEILVNIGINSNCMNALHTHDNSGKIHVESPEKRDFTLADFFAVWKKTYSREQILDSKVDAGHIIKETVNGKEAQDYENTILRDNDEIVISYEEKK